MESLQLPEDLVWNGKMEPVSPYSDELFPLSNVEGSWLFEDNFGNDILLYDKTSNNFELIDQDESPFNGEFIVEFELDCKEEQWYDGKPLNPAMDYPSPMTAIEQPTLITKVQYPYELAMEMDKVYGNPTELTQLTPPQTPPQDTRDLKEIYDLFAQHQPEVPAGNVPNVNVAAEIIPALSPASSYMDYSSDAISSPADEIARETQIVDDILRTRAKDLPDWTDDNESNYSLESSYMSQSNDDDWSPSSPSVASSLGSPQSGKVTHSGLSKKRSRPYGRGVEERKSRKKEQNKNAATRYRQKKKEEMKVILDEEQILTNRNEDLSKTVAEVEREIRYLKKLIKEFYRNKV